MSSEQELSLNPIVDTDTQASPAQPLSTGPAVRLIPPPNAISARSWNQTFPQQGRYLVTGDAGSGITSFLVDTVVNCIDQGVKPDSILVIAASKESGSRLREELALRMSASSTASQDTEHNANTKASADFVATSSLVRSVHSLAFALLRTTVQEEIRLITGAEQDAVIRELLQGHIISDGKNSPQSSIWPEEIHEALGLVGFARQLRDFLLRAIEREQTPDSLLQLGEQYDRPMWTAAGHFLREYEQVMSLAGVHSYSAAELVSEVLDHPEITASHPWEVIVVDDAQLLDPTSGKLINRLAESASLVVVGGDKEQAVFAFRGASTAFMDSFSADATIDLGTSLRTPPPACVAVTESENTQRNVIVDLIRRRHLDDGVLWQDIAVIVRSAGDIGAIRRTLLSAGIPVHINPTDVVLKEQRIVEAVLLGVKALTQPLTNSELEDFMTGPVGGADPVGLRRLIRALRRWQPNVRGMDSLREIIATLNVPESLLEKLNDYERSILQRVVTIISDGRVALEKHGTAEEVLWAIWAATGLSNRLRNVSLRGGATGSQADRDLDAMMALFDAAGDYSERRPGARLEQFIEHISEQELPTGVRDRRTAAPDAVSILTAHGAVGQQFDTVVVVGAQEGQWPVFGETGSLFGQEELIDYLDHGITPGTPVSHLSDRLAEERRLFHVATTRHTHRLAVVAVDNPVGEEVLELSRFVEEFALPASSRRNVVADKIKAEKKQQLDAWFLAEGMGVKLPAENPAASVLVPAEEKPDEQEKDSGLSKVLEPLSVSVLAVSHFVAHLRRIVCDEKAQEHRKVQAARQLARLAAEGVPGADPDSWWATKTIAEEPQLPPRDSLSPSRIEALLRCPLKAMLSDVVERGESKFHMNAGSVAHAYLEALGRGADEKEAKQTTLSAYAQLLDGPNWVRENRLAEFERLLDRIVEWLSKSRKSFELLGVEVPVDVEVPLDSYIENAAHANHVPQLGDVELRSGNSGAETIRIRGTIDRLESSIGDSNTVHIVDLKTSKNALSQAQVSDNAQLKAYQLALAHGKIIETHTGKRIVTAEAEDALLRDGASLVYPATDSVGITVRSTAAASEEQLGEFALQLPNVLEEMKGPRLRAQVNDECKHCRLKSICPARSEGEVTTNE
ncbi:MAG: ATP-dependent DNA helicase [Corynebacterium sp.]|nr:ATP-dependent DNA helicase [Corynebacterium sp.]